MGIVKHLLFWPVTGPSALARFAMRQVEEVAHQELTDDERIKEDLMALQLALEIGDIGEEEYVEQEARLMERLRAAREWRVELGMEEEWRPLGSVADPADEEPPADEPGAAEWSEDSSSDSPDDSSS